MSKRTYLITYSTVVPPEGSGDTMDGEPVWGEDTGFGDGWTLYPEEHGPGFTGPAYDAYIALARKEATNDADPDEYDISDYAEDEDTHEAAESRAAVALMVRALCNGGVTQANGGVACDSYSSTDADQDFRTGESTTYTYHLSGFTDSELVNIQSALRAKRLP